MTKNEEVSAWDVLRISLFFLSLFCALEGVLKGIQRLESGFMFTPEERGGGGTEYTPID